jgi:signal transduction histidine kinase
MGSRSTRLRTKVVALLLSLVALWSFAAWVTVRDGFNLLFVQTLDSRIAQPGEPLVAELQNERRLTTVYLGQPGREQRDALDGQWRRTTAAADAFRVSVRSAQARLAASDDARRRVDAVLAGLDGLAGIRQSVESKRLDRAEAADAYTAVVSQALRMYGSLGQLDDQQIAADTATLIDLYQVRELMSQEDALVAGVLSAGRMTGDEYARFARLVGAQRFLATEAVAELPAADRERYDRMVAGTAFTRFRSLEDRVVQQWPADGRVPVTDAQWRDAVGPALTDQETFIVAAGDALVERATPIAVGVIVRLVLAAGLGLIAVIASIVVSITTARALVRQLERLRDAAHRLAEERLPSVVERLGHGEEVDVAREAPPLEFGDDEIGQVGQAFNAVQETAVRTAVEQAELRRSVREVFLGLARRTQALVHRQLTLLDAMERREHDAEELEDLFRVDHLATRMRRNAENLIVLSGSTPGRSWRRNVPMVDVVRGAVAEVEDYTRVNVLPLGPVSLAGRAVGDVIHLLAELIENGLSFSPPHTTVEVRGQLVGSGFALEIEDRGLGMTEEDLAAANARIVDRAELNLADAARLGLYVVSRLTERHGVKVQLKESAYGGTTAVVLIPAELVTTDDPENSGAFRTTGPVPAGAPAGVALAQRATPVTAAPAEEAAPAAPTTGEPPVGAAGLPTRRRRPRKSTPATPPPAVEAAPPTVADPAPLSTGEPEPSTGEPEAETGTAGADPASPVDAGTAEQPTRTGSGLPIRVRQASLAPDLRTEDAPEGGPDADLPRPPEQVRRMMSAYQSGTRRGRTDAARLLEGAGRETEGAPDGADGQAT